MSSKGIFIIRVLLTPMCFICSASDLAIGIIRLVQHNIPRGIAFLFMGVLLFHLGYVHAKKAWNLWKSDIHNH